MNVLINFIGIQLEQEEWVNKSHLLIIGYDNLKSNYGRIRFSIHICGEMPFQSPREKFFNPCNHRVLFSTSQVKETARVKGELIRATLSRTCCTRAYGNYLHFVIDTFALNNIRAGSIHP